MLYHPGKAGVNMSLFPAYIENSNVAASAEKQQTAPREYEIDFETGQLTGGTVEGKEAVKVWIWLALQTPRYRYYIYTWDYGSDFEELIGRGYTEEYIATETQRMTEDCLLVNEHVQGIKEFSVNMEGSTLTISFVADTIYGEIEFKNQAVAAPV